ncbi:unnamed protein product [Schistosoma guineensis]|nr:unnamed protein product [Schistosoma guineensis]
MFDLGSYRPNHDPPAGMEPYDLPREGDLGALSNAQQGATNKLKAQTRLNNEHYLRKHPEIKYMITAFLREHFVGKLHLKLHLQIFLLVQILSRI